MMPTQPIVSVIIPTYNRLNFLQRALESVIAQTFSDWELWVIDDGSTDKTDAWMASFLSEKIHYLKTENLGVSHARNLGIKRSKSPWLAFLDSDDVWLPQKLEKQMALISAHPKAKVVHGEEIWIRNGVRVNPHKKHAKPEGRIFNQCLPLCCISPSTVLIHRDVLNQVGLFNEQFTVCEDYDLWLRISAQYPAYLVSDPIIKKYGGHEDQLSKKYRSMDYWRVKALAQHFANNHLSLEEKNNLLNMTIEKSEILLNGYKKYQNFNNYDEVIKINQTARQLLGTDSQCLILDSNTLK